MQNNPPTRYYLHGDRVEGDSFYCARCDAFTDRFHFVDYKAHTDGLKTHYDRYLSTRKTWRRIKNLTKEKEFSRPDAAFNLFAGGQP